MIDIHLRASGQIALDNALQKAGLLSDTLILSEGVLLDRIGEIARVTGYVDDEPVIEVIEGFHANLRLMFEPTAEQIEALYPVTILAPDQPVRVWAGG